MFGGNKEEANTNTLEWHINKNGLSNILLEDLMKMAMNDVADSAYQGVYTHFNIPSSLKQLPNFSIIVNVGAHFVAIYATPQYILYLDPFGTPIMQANIVHTLTSEEYDRPIFTNCRQVQALDSTHCGLFSCLFVLHLETKRLQTPFYKDVQLKFVSKNLTKNDFLCIKYLKRIIRK